MTAETPRLALIPEAITRAAEHDPTAPALAMAGREIGYGELERRANQVANTLRAGGVRRGDRVGPYARKSIIFGGEVFPTKDLRSLMNRLPGAGFANAYGPAEVSGATYSVVPPLPPDSDEPISIGRAYPGVGTLIVDDEDRVGAGSGRRALGRQSGSHGRVLAPAGADGTLDLCRNRCGRHQSAVASDRRRDRAPRRRVAAAARREGPDDQDLRVPGRTRRGVDAALAEHPAVEQAAVFPVPVGDGSRQIEAAVTLHAWAYDQDQPPSGAELRRHTARRLPRYAVPREVRVVESLAGTSTGKTDRIALGDRFAAPPS